MQLPPSSSGIGMINWYWRVVRQFVSERYGVNLTRSSCLNYLGRLGFALRRPKKYLVKENEARRKADCDLGQLPRPTVGRRCGNT